MMIGAGVSLLSGTNSTMLYESLCDLGREDEFRRRECLRGGMTLAQLRTQLARSPEAKLVYVFQHLAKAGLTP